MAKFTIWKRADGDGLEHLPELLESVASIYGDEDLSQDEREAMLRATFDEYEEFTGRDGLADIAATRGETKEPEMEKNVDFGAGAMFGLECLAASIRKREPELTEAQSFLRACEERPDILKIERQASRARLVAGYAVAREEPEILNVLSDAEIKRLIARERAKFPFLDGAALLARVEASDEMKAHRAALRQREAAARRDGSTWLSASVAKRDEAMSELHAKASDLRKAQPSLTQEGAFAKVYRLYPELARAEREASRAALFG
jgi:hypothetical protein